MLKKYFKRHFQFTELFTPEETEGGLVAPNKRKAKPGFVLFVRILRLLPLICLGGFITSFWVDFQQTDTLDLFGYTLQLEALLRVVSVSGLIGFSTNWIAIKMLFKPVLRRPIWGQGLIPAQKD
ncbi:MAG TPA: DUF445 family protein, partial [Bacteroidetes bacterium]|nr:DUF445 family protein [Bacteroidota bacterium]